MDTFVILTEVHIGVIYRIHLMIGPDPSTQSILYVFYGVHDSGDKAGQGKTLTLFCAWYCVVIYALCEALHCYAGIARSIILHEMINDLLCMNPVKAEQ